MTRHGRAAIVAVCALLMVSVGCLRGSHRDAAVALHHELEALVARLEATPAREEGCADAGSARGKLYADYGPTEIAAAWVPLRAATDALLAACGQIELLQLPSAQAEAPGVVAARERWREGVSRELRAACGWLGHSATLLERPAPSCTR